jgi:Icc protein
MSGDNVYFVQISDTHIGPTEDFNRHGHFSLPCAQRVVEVINTLPTRPDFVIHTGDVVDDPHPVSYQLAADTFAKLSVPIFYVNGNHDTVDDINSYLSMGPVTLADAERNRLSYTFDVKGYRFIVLDARGPEEIDPNGLLPDSQLELIAQEATPNGPPLVVFVHYPVLPLNSVWMDENMLILNGEQLHQALLPARNRLCGVFHGHVHQAMQSIRDGIIYYSGASVFDQFAAWPNDLVTCYDLDHEPGYNFVHLLPGQTIVHQHTFPRPRGIS